MALDRGTRTFTDPEDNMGSIPYSETPRSVIEGLYASILGRQPDEAGLDYWTSVLASGEPLSNIVNFFQGSTELAPMFQGGFDVNNDRNISAAEREAYLNSLITAPQDTPAVSDALDLTGGIDTSAGVDTTASANVLDLIGGVDTSTAAGVIDTTTGGGRSGDTRLGSEDVIDAGSVADANLQRAIDASQNPPTPATLPADTTLAARTYNGVVYDTVAEADAQRALDIAKNAGTTSPATTSPATTSPAITTTARGLSALTPVPTSTETSKDVVTSFPVRAAGRQLAPAGAFSSFLRRSEDQPFYNMYQEVLGRIPEAEGLAYWKSQFGNEISPTERAAFINATQGELNAKKAAAQAELDAKNAPPPAYTGPSLTYATQGFNAPVASGLQQALSSGMTKDQYLGNIKSYLGAGVAPGQILSDMTKYGITTDDLIAANALSAAGNTTGGNTGGAGGAPPPAGGTSEPVQVAASGGAVIRLAEGGETKAEPMRKFSLADLGSTFVAPADYKALFPYRSGVVFNPELQKAEDIERTRLAGDLRGLAQIERDRQMRMGLITSPGQERALRWWDDRFLPEISYANEGDKKYYESFDYDRNKRISPEEHKTYLNTIRGMKEGGVAKGLGSIAMKGYAEEMAQKGRFGDTMLAHISPDEAQMLKAMGGAGTVNPHTGLPEYFSWKKILKPIAKILPFVLPFTGIGLPLQALVSGVAGGLGGEKGFDFKRGLMSGLMSYGMGSLAQGAGQAGGLPTTDPSMAAGQSLSGEIAAPTVGEAPKFGNIFTSDKGVLSQLGENVQAVGQGAMGAATGAPGAREAFTAGQGQVFGKTLTPTMAAGATAVGMGGVKAADEMTKFELQQAMINAKTDEERERYRQLFLRTLGNVGFAGGGGIGALAKGGATGPANSPRVISGAGDGMSDSVPANIEGIQEARLADGEFVIPADVVADLGNGSSNAGSKKLFAMMDRVRRARHGTDRQPPEVNMNRLMPA